MRSLKIQSLLVLCAAVFLSILPLQAQQASPPGSAEITVDGKKITVNYHRPSMKGRKIFGGLVPYGKVWRTGANNATSLKTEADLMFGNVVVPAGSYTLWTLPTETGWKLIINKQTGQWGTQYSEGQDLARVDMKVGKLTAPVEQFTLTLAATKNGGILKLDWETTTASVAFKVKN
jgi:Protein of unknown function (DUF2911)